MEKINPSFFSSSSFFSYFNLDYLSQSKITNLHNNQGQVYTGEILFPDNVPVGSGADELNLLVFHDLLHLGPHLTNLNHDVN